MISVTKPTDKVVLEVLEGLLSRTYTREEIYTWQNEMREHYAEYHPGCMSILSESKTGNFIVQSLIFINDKGISKSEPTDKYFIRDEDIQEYIFDLNNIDCTEINGNVERLRNHQLEPITENDYPLVCISLSGDVIFKRFEIFFTRGIVDDLAEHVEYASIKFKNSVFYLQYSHWHDEHQFTIFGFKGSDSDLACMLIELKFLYQEISWISDYALIGKTELWRFDDNDNEFLMSEYNSQLEAELKRKEYEAKGHKQTYFLKSSSL